MPPTLGIMALYKNEKKQFEERAYFKQLFQTGKELDLAIILFSPDDVDHAKKRIYSHLYDTQKRRWQRKWTPFPDLVFDRCRFQRHPRFAKLRDFRDKYPNLLYLNRPMANKWIIYENLNRHTAMQTHLPDTQIVNKTGDLVSFLSLHTMAYFKPINGTGGRGILKIERKGKGLYRVEGRRQDRQIVPAQLLNRQQLALRLQAWRGKFPYLIQQGIDLTLPNGRVHDYRLLMQKNGRGVWELSGSAGRIGPQNSVTSNLHGGGHAISTERLLQHWFPDAAKQEEIRQEMSRLAHTTVRALEQSYSQMCELALDIAVDRHGHPWLLEINPKPAREVFRQLGETKVYQRALARPLQYALWLYQNR